jgi:hypothetical protein
MKHVLVFAAFILSTASSYAGTCAFYKESKVAGSELSFEVTATGSRFNTKKFEISENQTLEYAIDLLTPKENGCYPVFLSMGITQDRNTWVNSFATACEGDEVHLSSYALGQASLRCKI